MFLKKLAFWVSVVSCVAVFALGAPGLEARRSGAVSPVQIEALSAEGVAASGQIIQLPLLMKIAPGWHTGVVPESAAVAADDLSIANALQFHWQLPDGYEVLAVHGPAPKTFELNGVSTVGYADVVRLVADVQLPDHALASTLAPHVTVDWVACDTQCIPGTSDVTLALPPLQASANGAGWMQMWSWLALAALGGLLLNFMPCVLPVLGLKVMQLIQHSHMGRGQLFKQTMAYTVGVLGCFLVLGILMIALKGAGVALGWGFQLQSPLFVGLMALLMAAMGFSQLGGFEIGSSMTRLGGAGRQQGWLAGVSAGVLTTLVATPCTGPFLGSAMAFGLTLPVMGQLAMMLAIGLGMVAPFLLVVAFPRALHWLPKPGAWMLWLKRVMGVLLALSSAWLVWVFQALVPGAALWLIAAMALVIVAFRVYGMVQLRRERGMPLDRLPLLSSAILGMGLVPLWLGVTKPPQELTAQQSEHVYSRQRVQEMLKTGKPVLIDFTARWCLLCQANKPVLYSEQVQSLLNEKGVVLLEADLTQRQPELMADLSSYGREGLPAYVLLQPGQKPMLLPELLHESDIHKALDQITQH